MRIFIIAAVVLVVFAIIASAAQTGMCLSVSYSSWLAASLLAFFVDLLLGDRVITLLGTRQRPTP